MAPSPVPVFQNHKKIGEYILPTLGCPTVSPLLLSRPLLLRLCNGYLLSGDYHAGVELLERVFYKVKRLQASGCEDPSLLFAMHGQLATPDLKTVFVDESPDSELLLYYIKFLLLLGDITKAVYLLSCLPRGLNHDVDMLLLHAYLTYVLVSNGDDCQ